MQRHAAGRLDAVNSRYTEAYKAGMSAVKWDDPSHAVSANQTGYCLLEVAWPQPVASASHLC